MNRPLFCSTAALAVGASHRSRWSISNTFVALCSALLVALCASSAHAAKAAPPAPTPTCNAPGSMIPAMSFAHSYQLYVGNADGTCAIQLAKLAQQYQMAFAFNGTTNQYRVFWTADTRDEVKLISRMRWTVKMVEFTVGADGGINEPLPLPVRELYRDAVTTSESSVGSISANAAGDQVIFTRTYGGAISIERIDLTSCTNACPIAEHITVASNVSSVVVQFGSGSAGNKRIYLKEILTTTGEQVLAFIEKSSTSGLWEGPRVVASTSNAPYVGAKFGGMRIAQQDWDGLGVSSELIAVPWIAPGSSSLLVDVLRIEPGCTVIGTGSCLGDTTASVVASRLPAYVNYYGIDWMDGSLLRVNDTSGTRVIESFDPHYPSNIKIHGPGLNPAGLKQ